MASSTDWVTIWVTALDTRVVAREVSSGFICAAARASAVRAAATAVSAASRPSRSRASRRR